jgi:cellulose synthase/poly-beta-1,6-N-acetylglucosamine synthase-like glycosyltransferase
LLDQKGIEFDFFLLDDSSRLSERQRIDNWSHNQSTAVRIVRRSDRLGYKGGNINHWLARFGDPTVYPYVLLVDADEHVPPDFAYHLLKWLTSNNFAFAQACHVGTAELRTPFQRLLHPQVECVWLHQVPAWNFSGIPPMLGHGVLLRTDILKAVGGFPNVVSEDLAFTMLLAEKGLSGVVATKVIGQEAFPESYRAYWNRRRRWIQADTEIVRKLLRNLWKSRVGLIARLCLSVRELCLTIASCYWLLLVAATLMTFFSIDKKVVLSSFAWVLLLVLLVPALPALRIKRLSIKRRILYVCTVAFVGAAVSSLNPVASGLGLLGYHEFNPTGSRHDHTGTVFSLWRVWESLSGIFFFVGGILAGNWSLAAVGFAIGCSPLMRTRWEIVTLVGGSVIFWSLILFQIYIDADRGSVPIEHLLVLVGLTINLI